MPVFPINITRKMTIRRALALTEGRRGSPRLEPEGVLRPERAGEVETTHRCRRGGCGKKTGMSHSSRFQFVPLILLQTLALVLLTGSSLALTPEEPPAATPGNGSGGEQALVMESEGSSDEDGSERDGSDGDTEPADSAEIADPPEGDEALIAAAEAGDLPTVAGRLGAGAEVNGIAEGRTALMAAVAGDRASMVEYLLTEGAHLEVRNGEGNTALFFAPTASVNMVERLLGHGAKVDVRNQAGDSPLHLAVDQGNAEMVRALLDHGADRDLRDGQDRTALDRARAAGHDEVVTVLSATSDEDD